MEIINLRERTEWTEAEAVWFHFKWEIAQEEYEKSIRESQQTQGAIPRWYLVTDNREIIAGVGVIANDFHKRKDLTPNLCALYVEEAYRGRGNCRRVAAPCLRGDGAFGDRYPLSGYRPYLILRAVRLGIFRYG